MEGREDILVVVEKGLGAVIGFWLRWALQSASRVVALVVWDRIGSCERKMGNDMG